MITFEKQNNIQVATIDYDTPQGCQHCIFPINSIECENAECKQIDRSDSRSVFFLSVYDKRILNFKANK